MLLRKLNNASPTRCSISTTNNYVFQYVCLLLTFPFYCRFKLLNAQTLILVDSYMIESGVCYLALCDNKFSKKLAYGYLEEIHREFHVRSV